MIHDPAHMCHMTFDRVKGHARSRLSKSNFTKNATPPTEYLAWYWNLCMCITSTSSTFLQKLLDHFWSRVIQGHSDQKYNLLRHDIKMWWNNVLLLPIFVKITTQGQGHIQGHPRSFSTIYIFYK